jgi:UDP-2-acetamido-3-amino-2,3-dideoxy-glucuronate N-acetyltransferase
MDPLVDRGAPLIHPTAEVEDGAEVGAGTRVWHFAHVRSGARIGERCVLGKSVFVDSGVVIGAGCRIQNFVSIYSGVSPFEDDVFVGPSAVSRTTAALRPPAGSGTGCRPWFAWAPRSGRNATVLCGLTIGELAVVGAGAVVTADVEPHRLVVGNPAKPVGWVCRCGRGVPGGPGTACPACGEDLTL